MTRRELLMLLPCVALAETSTRPHIDFPASARDRLAVTSWPFRAYIESPTNHARKASVPGMDLKSFPSFVVEKFGVQNINPLLDHFSSTEEAYLDEFRVSVRRASSHVVDLGLGGRNFFSADAATRREAIGYGRQGIDVAVRIGSPSVRQHLHALRGEKLDPAIGAEGLGQLAGYGAARNVVVNLENDDPVAEDPFLIVSMVDKVNSPYLRALPDFGNTLIAHDENFNVRAVKTMLAHAWNMCHVKDSVEDDQGHSKKVDLATMFRLAKESRYRGYYSMEFDADAGDPIEGTQRLVQESLHYLG